MELTREILMERGCEIITLGGIKKWFFRLLCGCHAASPQSLLKLLHDILVKISDESSSSSKSIKTPAGFPCRVIISYVIKALGIDILTSRF